MKQLIHSTDQHIIAALDEEVAVASDISSSEDMAAARRWTAPGQIKINKYKRTEELGYRDCTSHGPETVVVDGGKRA